MAGIARGVLAPEFGENVPSTGAAADIASESDRFRLAAATEQAKTKSRD